MKATPLIGSVVISTGIFLLVVVSMMFDMVGILAQGQLPCLGAMLVTHCVT